MEQVTARKFLIATHGTFAKGIQSSLDLIIGAMDNVYTIQAYVTENKSIEDDLNVILKDLKDDEELVILSDLLGGSVTNQILRYALRPNVHVVSGFNLPLLIDIVMSDIDTPVIEVIEESINNAKQQMVYVNKLVNQDSEDSLDD